MRNATYHIISETTEDRFDEAESRKEAIEIARGLMKESQVEEPVLIEYQGRVICQLFMTPEGQVKEKVTGN